MSQQLIKRGRPAATNDDVTIKLLDVLFVFYITSQRRGKNVEASSNGFQVRLIRPKKCRPLPSERFCSETLNFFFHVEKEKIFDSEE